MSLLDTVKKSTTKTTKAKAPKKSKAEVEVQSVASTTTNSGAAYRILLRPVVSEKAATGEAHRSYTFAVAVDATKTQIKSAIRTVYGVTPSMVRTIQVEGKRVRSGRTAGRRKDWKKAIVTVPAGSSLSIHEGV